MQGAVRARKECPSRGTPERSLGSPPPEWPLEPRTDIRKHFPARRFLSLNVSDQSGAENALVSPQCTEGRASVVSGAWRGPPQQPGRPVERGGTVTPRPATAMASQHGGPDVGCSLTGPRAGAQGPATPPSRLLPPSQESLSQRPWERGPAAGIPSGFSLQRVHSASPHTPGVAVAVPHPPPSHSPALPRPTDTHQAAGPLHGLPAGEAPGSAGPSGGELHVGPQLPGHMAGPHHGAGKPAGTCEVIPSTNNTQN